MLSAALPCPSGACHSVCLAGVWTNIQGAPIYQRVKPRSLNGPSELQRRRGFWFWFVGAWSGAALVTNTQVRRFRGREGFVQRRKLRGVLSAFLQEKYSDLISNPPSSTPSKEIPIFLFSFLDSWQHHK